MIANATQDLRKKPNTRYFHFAFLFSTMLLFQVSFSLFNYYPLLVADRFSDFEIGLMMGIPRFVVIPLGILFFILNRWIHHRIWLMWVGLFSIFHYLGFVYATQNYHYWILVIFLGVVISINNAFPIVLLAKITPQGARASWMAFFGIAGNLSQALAFLLADFIRYRFGITDVFYASSILNALVVMIVGIWMFMIPKVENDDLQLVKEKKEASKISLLQYWPIYGAGILVGASFFSLLGTIPKYSQLLGLKYPSMFPIAYSFVMVVVRFMTAKLMNFLVPGKVLRYVYSGLLVIFFSTFMLHYFTHSWLLFVIGAGYGLVHNFMFPMTNLLFMKFSPKNLDQGALLYTILFNFGGSMGILLIGFLEKYISIQYTYIILGILLFATGMGTMLNKRNQQLYFDDNRL